jgi:hypothetical protein
MKSKNYNSHGQKKFIEKFINFARNSWPQAVAIAILSLGLVYRFYLSISKGRAGAEPAYDDIVYLLDGRYRLEQLDLNFFKQDIFHSSNSLFDTVAWTTLSDVRNEFLDVSYTNWNEDVAKDFIEKNKINELSELRNIKSGFGLSHWLRENNLTEKFFGESKIKPWTDKTAKDFIKNCKAKKISDLRNHEKGSGLINWIINNDLTFTYFPETKQIELIDETIFAEPTQIYQVRFPGKDISVRVKNLKTVNFS